MTIKEAIKKAKKEYEWFKSEDPVTVLVGFEDYWFVVKYA